MSIPVIRVVLLHTERTKNENRITVDPIYVAVSWVVWFNAA